MRLKSMPQSGRRTGKSSRCAITSAFPSSGRLTKATLWPRRFRQSLMYRACTSARSLASTYTCSHKGMISLSDHARQECCTGWAASLPEGPGASSTSCRRAWGREGRATLSGIRGRAAIARNAYKPIYLSASAVVRRSPTYSHTTCPAAILSATNSPRPAPRINEGLTSKRRSPIALEQVGGECFRAPPVNHGPATGAIFSSACICAYNTPCLC
jgi:hypothetical protein